jgi:hypothetical protein
MVQVAAFTKPFQLVLERLRNPQGVKKVGRQARARRNVRLTIPHVTNRGTHYILRLSFFVVRPIQKYNFIIDSLHMESTD